VSGDGGLLQGGCCLLLLQEGACGPGTAACGNRLLLGFLGVLDESVEFGFEGGDVSRCSTYAGAEVENLATGPVGEATWGRWPGEAAAWVAVARRGGDLGAVALGGGGLLWWRPEGRLPGGGSHGVPGLGLG
jgi:hypothetical protein